MTRNLNEIVRSAASFNQVNFCKSSFSIFILSNFWGKYVALWICVLMAEIFRRVESLQIYVEGKKAMIRPERFSRLQQQIFHFLFCPGAFPPPPPPPPIDPPFTSSLLRTIPRLPTRSLAHLNPQLYTVRSHF